MKEYMSLTNSSSGQVSITYNKYFMMLQTACIRYDGNLSQKLSTTSKAVYQHELDDDYIIHDEEDDYLDDNYAPDGIDTPSDEIYPLTYIICRLRIVLRSDYSSNPPRIL